MVPPGFQPRTGSPHVSYTQSRVFRHYPARTGRRGDTNCRILIQQHQIARSELPRQRQVRPQKRRHRVRKGGYQAGRERTVSPQSFE